MQIKTGAYMLSVALSAIFYLTWHASAESTAAKLPASKVTRPDPLPKQTDARLKTFEDALAGLHSKAFDTFTFTEGFGMWRLPPMKWNDLELQGEPPITILSTEDLEEAPKLDLKPFETFHLLSITQFSKPTPHASTHLPRARRWKVQSLDLIGLVKHDEPVAYVTKKLPQMNELRKVPTRPLDVFEGMGLERLTSGDDLFARTSGKHLRVLGSLRAGTACMECHSGKRGDLLGAFSYTLKPMEVARK